jgi:tetrahydromethanopterin S-methyltransferase subunit F
LAAGLAEALVAGFAAGFLSVLAMVNLLSWQQKEGRMPSL